VSLPCSPSFIAILLITFWFLFTVFRFTPSVTANLTIPRLSGFSRITLEDPTRLSKISVGRSHVKVYSLLADFHSLQTISVTLSPVALEVFYRSLRQTFDCISTFLRNAGSRFARFRELLERSFLVPEPTSTSRLENYASANGKISSSKSNSPSQAMATVTREEVENSRNRKNSQLQTLSSSQRLVSTLRHSTNTTRTTFTTMNTIRCQMKFLCSR